MHPVLVREKGVFYCSDRYAIIIKKCFVKGCFFMNFLKRVALKVLSAPKLDLRKDYASIRRMQQMIHPDLSKFYDVVDKEIVREDENVVIPIRIFCPDKREKKLAIIFFHGGGWVTGDIETYTSTCIHLSENLGLPIFSVDYRLAPEHPYPSGLNDCFATVQALEKDLELLGVSSFKQVILMGDSAGGNLAAATSLMRRDKGLETAGYQILLYPATYWAHDPQYSPFKSVRVNSEGYGLTSKKMVAYMDMYAPNIEDRRSSYVSPLMEEDLSNQPKTLIVTAEYDVLRDEGELYGKGLAEDGNEVKIVCMKDEVHGFMSLPPIAESVKATYKEIRQFLDMEVVPCEKERG